MADKESSQVSVMARGKGDGMSLSIDIDRVEEIHRDMLPAREESHSLGVHI